MRQVNPGGELPTKASTVEVVVEAPQLLKRLRGMDSGCLWAMHGAIHRMMYLFDADPNPRSIMRTTLNLDDALLEEARRLTGMRERTALIHEGLRALIERESARRLARLGGSEPDLQPTRRRQSDTA